MLLSSTIVQFSVGKTAPLRGDCDTQSHLPGNLPRYRSEKQPRFEGIATESSAYRTTPIVLVGKTAPLRGDCDIRTKTTSDVLGSVSEKQPRFEGIATGLPAETPSSRITSSEKQPRFEGIATKILSKSILLISLMVGKTAPLRGDCDR